MSQPLTCHVNLDITSFALLISSELHRLLSYLVVHGGTNHLNVFPLFIKRDSDFIVTKFAAVFRIMKKAGRFPLCWRSADISPVTKGPLSSFIVYYRPIVYERLLSAQVCRFLESCCVLPFKQLTFR